MKASDRREALLRIMCRRRHETVSNLAFEFDVCARTILRDVHELSLSYPIYTVCGKSYGGVYVEEDYYLGKQYLTPQQEEILTRMIGQANEADKLVIQSIIESFQRRGGKQ